MLSQDSGESSIDNKFTLVTCPEGKSAVGGGARLIGSNGALAGPELALDISSVNDDGSTWIARAHEVVPTGATWHLLATVICASKD